MRVFGLYQTIMLLLGAALIAVGGVSALADNQGASEIHAVGAGQEKEGGKRPDAGRGVKAAQGGLQDDPGVRGRVPRGQPSGGL